MVEQKTYTGGTVSGYWAEGASAASDGFNVYQLSVGSPSQSFYLNAGTTGIFNCFGIDYEATIEAYGGAEVTLLLNPRSAVYILSTLARSARSPPTGALFP